MPKLRSIKHEQFCQHGALGLSCAEAYRRVSGNNRNADVHSDEWMRCRGVAARITELRAANDRRAQFSRDEALRFLGDVIRQSADKVKPGSWVIQSIKRNEDGTALEIKLPDKVQCVAQLSRMCGWDQPQHVLLTSDPLLRYLQELRGTPINSRPVECEPRQLGAPLQEETLDESQDVGA